MRPASSFFDPDHSIFNLSFGRLASFNKRLLLDFSYQCDIIKVMDKTQASGTYRQKYLINELRYLQIKPDTEKAVEFYKTHLLQTNGALHPLLQTYNFKSELPSWKWELFVAILVGDIATAKSRRGTKGADLLRHEVKTAQNGRDFEYQYHKKSWAEKLEKESQINHVYVSYRPEFKDLDVRMIPGKELTHHFEKWRPLIIEAYECPKPKQRFRKRITYKEVVEKGQMLLRIKNGNLLTDQRIC